MDVDRWFATWFSERGRYESSDLGVRILETRYASKDNTESEAFTILLSKVETDCDDARCLKKQELHLEIHADEVTQAL